MKRIFTVRTAALLVLLALALSLFVSCKDGDGTDTGETTAGGGETLAPAEKMDLLGMDLSPYIAVKQYKGVPVTVRELDYVVALRELLREDGAYYEEYKGDEITVAEGDIVNVNYTGYLKGKQFEGGKASNQDVTVCDGMGYIDGFATGFIGATVGEASSFDVTFPENYGEPSLAGQEVTFEFTVNYVYVFDDVTDEMAKDLSDGEFTTAADFEADLRSHVVQKVLWEKILDEATVKKYPEQHLNYYYRNTRTVYEYYADRNGMSYESFLKAMGLTDADLYDSAKLYVKEDLVTFAIRNAEQIELSEEEYDAKIGFYIKRYKDELNYTDAEIEENMEQIEENMLFDKLQSLLVEWADVTWEGRETAPDGDEMLPDTE